MKKRGMQHPDGLETIPVSTLLSQHELLVDILDAIGNFIDALHAMKALYLRTVLNLKNQYGIDFMDDTFNLDTRGDVLKVHASIRLRPTGQTCSIAFYDFEGTEYVFGVNKMPDLIAKVTQQLEVFAMERNISLIPDEIFNAITNRVA